MLTGTHEMIILKHASMKLGYKYLTIKQGLEAIVKVSSPLTDRELLKCKK